MGKYETHLQGNFDQLLAHINQSIIHGSTSASFEDGSDIQNGPVRCAVRVYERYSMTGGNRVSLNVTLLGCGDDLFVSGITAGGSQALFFKMNRFGENSFLDHFIWAINNYLQAR